LRKVFQTIEKYFQNNEKLMRTVGIKTVDIVDSKVTKYVVKYRQLEGSTSRNRNHLA
jgi:hemerythrin